MSDVTRTYVPYDAYGKYAGTPESVYQHAYLDGVESGKEEAADELTSLRARVAELEGALAQANIRAWRYSEEISSAEFKIAEKHCDWVSFKCAFNGIMNARRAALNPP